VTKVRAERNFSTSIRCVAGRCCVLLLKASTTEGARPRRLWPRRSLLRRSRRSILVERYPSLVPSCLILAHKNATALDWLRAGTKVCWWCSACAAALSMVTNSFTKDGRRSSPDFAAAASAELAAHLSKDEFALFNAEPKRFPKLMQKL
jgi:hypothetical protein